MFMEWLVLEPKLLISGPWSMSYTLWPYLQLSCSGPLAHFLYNHNICQMGMPLLIALVLAIKALGSALLLRIKPNSGVMSLMRLGQ